MKSSASKAALGIVLLAGTALFAGLAGCATPQSAYAWPRTGDPIADGKAAIEQGPPKDRVLWQFRTALEAMRRSRHAEAKALLDDALLTLSASTAGDAEAKRARSLFSDEAQKVFRGEPYERVMAWYYRGILYWMDGEPDNARACFRSAQVEDGDAENQEYASDYALLDYLDGFASVKLGGDGSDAFKRAQKALRQGELPPYDAKANTLLFLEFGRAPVKYATGDYDEELRFREGQSPARSAMVKLGGTAIPVAPHDDLHFQATTRGGRVMDHILANKAVFKTTTDVAGNAALIGGLIVAQNRKHQDVGLGLAAIGLVSKIVSAATTPAADTRYWNNLPQFLGFAALPLPEGQHTVTVEFLDGTGSVLPKFTKTLTIQTSSDRDTVVFVSDQSHTSQY